jgi:PAS domain S-box-containing protein
MRAGAHDYLMKHSLARLVPAIERELNEAVNRRARKQAEAQLRLQSVALEAAANAILITDANGEIVWANPAFTETTGYSFMEVVGKNPRVLKSGKQDHGFYKEMWDTILSGNVWRNTLINRRKDGSLNHEDMTITPIRDGSGKITQFVAIKQDITKLDQALSDVKEKNEELASMTQQLWQASKLATMGELSASVAHELNNPLATVALRVESLLMPMAEDDPKRRSLEIITQEVDRMANLVHNLLQFSRRSHRQVSTVDVREEITNSIEFVHYHLRNRRIEVVHEFDDPLPTIQADRQQLRQLFLNLLTNAGDAMPQGGTLTVNAKYTVLREAEAVQIDFSDSGDGISAENLEKIWEPFFTTKPEGKGTGLGLAICRRIVEEHGGKIDIESAAGSGTTVHIGFPATTNEVAQSIQ